MNPDNLQSYFDDTADKIIAELTQPQYSDLLFAVVNHMGEQDSFMFTFTKPRKLTFDEFALLTQQVNDLLRVLRPGAPQDMRSTSVRYDEHLAQEDASTLSESQTERWSAIMAKFDDGWSGAVYGILMRNVQFKLRRVLSN